MSETEGCIFCGFDPAFIIDESEHSFAAHFDCAIKRGHIVVALKSHVVSLSQLSPEQSSDIMSLAARVARKAEPIIGCGKFYIAAIADVTPHFHIHLLPKMPGDPSLGPHIMGENGWRGEAGELIGHEDIEGFIKAYKA